MRPRKSSTKSLIATNESFAKIYASQKEFRDRSYFYHQAADFQFDTMMLQLKRKYVIRIGASHRPAFT